MRFSARPAGRVNFSEIKNLKNNREKNQRGLKPCQAVATGRGLGAPEKIKQKSNLRGKSKPAPKQAAPVKQQTKNVMADYFSMAMKECAREVPSAEDLQDEIEGYIKARGGAARDLSPRRPLQIMCLTARGFWRVKP